MSLKDQLKKYYANGFRQTDSFYFGETPKSLLSSGLDYAPLAMRQDDFKKSTKEKHSIPRRVLNLLHQHLEKPIFSFSAGKQVAVLIDDMDSNGLPVVVAIHGGHTMDRSAVNIIASIYGIGDTMSFSEWIEKQIKGGSKFKVYDIEKANAILQTHGYLAAVGERSVDSWDRITQIPKEVNTSTKKYSLRNKNISNLDHEYFPIAEKYRDGTASEEETEQLRKMVDEAAKKAMPNTKAVDENNAPLRVKHGTDADFFAFDINKAGKNGRAEGFGFYFSDDQEITSKYGNRQIDCYLDITKPLYGDRVTLSKAEVRKFVNDFISYEIKRDESEWKDSFISNYVDTYSRGMTRQYGCCGSQNKRKPL